MNKQAFLENFVNPNIILYRFQKIKFILMLSLGILLNLINIFSVFRPFDWNLFISGILICLGVTVGYYRYLNYEKEPVVNKKNLIYSSINKLTWFGFIYCTLLKDLLKTG